MTTNTNVTEDLNDIQTYVVSMRKKYSDKISKYYEQNNKIELKLLEKQQLQSEQRLEILKEFSLEENLVDCLNQDLIDKKRCKILKDKLKNLDTILMQHIKMKNCDLYQHITEKRIIK